MKMIKQLYRDKLGTFAIETALVAPVLAIMAGGIIEASTMVARQHELQSAALEIEAIALAVNEGAEVELAAMQEILQKSVKLDEGQVTVSRFYRCDLNTVVVMDPVACNPDPDTVAALEAAGEEVPVPIISSYLKIEISDTHTPAWVGFGIGKPITFNVERSVLLA